MDMGMDMALGNNMVGDAFVGSFEGMEGRGNMVDMAGL